ncbi:MAG: HAD-IA family hydrolase [Alphaproteobacteria bacterium]|nr:HAD-IA family hydrolase [Alphaproteobacteria bacterium]
MAVPHAILFDLDGTLIDSAPDLGAAADQMRVDRGLPSLPLEGYRHMAGAGARGMLGIAFGMTPEHPQFGDYKEEFFRNYERRLTQLTRAFDGVAQMLQSLQQRGLAWGIVTNKSSRFTDPLVRQMALLNPAAVVISGDTTPHAKPHPEPLFEAARRLQLNTDQCWYVGDDERDIVAGRAAGMLTCAATYGYLGAVADWQAWGADAAIDHPQGVLKKLESA